MDTKEKEKEKGLVKFSEVQDFTRVKVPVELGITKETFKKELKPLRKVLEERGLHSCYFTTITVNENGNRKSKLVARAEFFWNHKVQFENKVHEAGLTLPQDSHKLLRSQLSHCDFNDSIITIRGKKRDLMKEILGEKDEGARAKAQREIIEKQKVKALKVGVSKEQMKAIFGE